MATATLVFAYRTAMILRSIIGLTLRHRRSLMLPCAALGGRSITDLCAHFPMHSVTIRSPWRSLDQDGLRIAISCRGIGTALVPYRDEPMASFYARPRLQ